MIPSDSSSTGNPPHLDTQKIRLAGLPNRRVKLGSVDPPITALLHHTLTPTLASGSLLLSFVLMGVPITSAGLALAVIVFIASLQLITAPAGVVRLNNYWTAVKQRLPKLTMEWLWLASLLLFIDFKLNTTNLLNARVMLCWSIIGPALLLHSRLLKQFLSGLKMGGPTIQRYIIVGANELALELKRRTSGDSDRVFMGYFDDRSHERLPSACVPHLLGAFDRISEYVKFHQISAVFIALPEVTNPRMRALIKALRDTTASVYFVPPIMLFDTIQARMAEIDGMPVVSLYDTPLDGVNAVYKRALDIVLSSAILLMIWPLLLLIAIGIKLSSPGPALFKQYRYGLHGERITVYKFRSMRVQENGARVTQATRGDTRITRFGAFLRKTSLDELPQIINVLQGRMSLVGPRPHAVAHNEEYRKLIDGYMFRHKVRPGITGWAQVNGLRGETETIDKMQKRVEFDLNYLRHWSLWMDLKIILKTARLVFGDSSAY